TYLRAAFESDGRRVGHCGTQSDGLFDWAGSRVLCQYRSPCEVATKVILEVTKLYCGDDYYRPDDRRAERIGRHCCAVMRHLGYDRSEHLPGFETEGRPPAVRSLAQAAYEDGVERPSGAPILPGHDGQEGEEDTPLTRPMKPSAAATCSA